MTSPPPLARVLGTSDAVVVGLSAMLGAGVFVVFAPAAESSGNLLLVALALAAIVAFCNATASAQLATVLPAAGGTYVFGREMLGPTWGFVAGWGFVVGKIASCAAMALTFATYALPDAASWLQRGTAAAAVLALTVATMRGMTRTMTVAKILLAATLATLVVAAVILAGTDGGSASAHGDLPDPSAWGVLQGAGLLFFAFAGYARIATLAEEVRSPANISRAIIVAFVVVIGIYFVMAHLLVTNLGADLPRFADPVAGAVSHVAWAEPVVRVGAAAACLGALLALLTGIGRTTLAMAREHDLPAPLAAVGERHRVPHRAQLVIGLFVVALVLAFDVRAATGFSSFGVLVYYAVTNLSALRQAREHRRWPRLLHVGGFAGCVTLAVTLPREAVLVGVAVVAVGLALRAVRHAVRG